MDATTAAQLADWRREVSDLYSQVRRDGTGERSWLAWRAGRHRLYREHPQSPVPAARRQTYAFACFPYDPGSRVLGELLPTSPVRVEGDADLPGMTRVGALRFTLGTVEHHLGVFWLDGYAGGLFVPFADSGSGSESYGGGRYLIDSAKGADLGSEGGRFILDFNFAYAPSCAHDPQCRCPLAPATNRLAVTVRAGEQS